MHQSEELHKIIISLMAVIVGSWGLFGWVVKRWIKGTDTRIKDVEQNTGKNNITIAQIKIEIKNSVKNLDRLQNTHDDIHSKRR